MSPDLFLLAVVASTIGGALAGLGLGFWLAAWMLDRAVRATETAERPSSLPVWR